MNEEPAKLSLLTPLRLSVTVNERVIAAGRRRGLKRPEWIRQAIIAQLERDEAEAAARGIITPEQAALLELCAAASQRGIDPQRTLADALEAKLSAEATAAA